MDFFDVIKSRRSIRAFQSKPVEKDKIDTLLEAVRTAPTAGNLQAYQVVLVDDQSIKEQLANAAWGQHFIAEAPFVLVFFADPERSACRYGKRGANLYSLQDATIACSIAHFAAHALGLGSVWVGAFNDAQVSRAVNAPASLKPVAILPIGYPAEKPEPTDRRDISSFVKKNKF